MLRSIVSRIALSLIHTHDAIWCTNIASAVARMDKHMPVPACSRHAPLFHTTISMERLRERDQNEYGCITTLHDRTGGLWPVDPSLARQSEHWLPRQSPLSQTVNQLQYTASSTSFRLTVLVHQTMVCRFDHSGVNQKKKLVVCGRFDKGGRKEKGNAMWPKCATVNHSFSVASSPPSTPAASLSRYADPFLMVGERARSHFSPTRHGHSDVGLVSRSDNRAPKKRDGNGWALQKGKRAASIPNPTAMLRNQAHGANRG
ncbi:hypothetical protein B0I35DRAFT_431460 [Stachybotrys elegans]|uniref:Uncharacterized protein n=1 Tax=Stachybotrys elegans TaxID=80388 RepID=A0A8K0SLK8_9HYPO|nr:hypothetical protein B0I35DRAFT_431460 [Stachybotrys elegans]